MRGITWKFLPPSASHMAGVWERQIRSVRKVLSSIVGCQRIDDERLSTLLCEVEAVLNSRPLTTVSSDGADLEPLTPNHILRAYRTDPLPLGGASLEEASRRGWRHAQLLADRFWNRWTREYTHALRMRQGKLERSRNFAVDDVVLVVDNSLPRNRWKVGRVVEAFPGHDGLVRKVRVRTPQGILLRPITKVCLLEGHQALSASATPHPAT